MKSKWRRACKAEIHNNSPKKIAQREKRVELKALNARGHYQLAAAVRAGEVYNIS